MTEEQKPPKEDGERPPKIEVEDELRRKEMREAERKDKTVIEKDK